MKELWLRLDASASLNQKTKLLKIAEERCSVAVLSTADLPLASGLKLKTASTDDRSEIKLLSVFDPPRNRIAASSAVELVVKDSSDEERALQLVDAGVRYLLVSCPDWKVIPLENLIAKTGDKAMLMAEVSSVIEAKVALQTLELGVHGVVLNTTTVSDIEEIDSFLKQSQETVLLVKASVVSVKPLGPGMRVCVDTCELMEPGEGMLVGSQSTGLFLVEAEVHKNPHVESRPFRVNAGPVSSYALTPGFKTRYLSELRSGDQVLIVNRSGAIRAGHIARTKIERRPMMLVETGFNGHTFSIIVQNAETVRLVSDVGSKPVSELKTGDEILVRVEEGGRHFGTLVADEMVIER